MWLGPYYLGRIRVEDKEGSYRCILARLYHITEYVTRAEELERLLVLARIHSVRVIADDSLEKPFIASMYPVPPYHFNNTKITVKVKQYDIQALRDLVAGNYRGELVHGVLYALLGHIGIKKYKDD